MGRMKKRSASEAHSTIDAIYDSEVEKLNQNGICSDSIILYLKPFCVLKSSLYYIRKKTLPQSTDEIELPSKLSQTTENKSFLLFDTKDSDRIFCNYSDVGFEILCGNEQWHLDGTFSAAPSIYYQLFINHGFYNNETNTTNLESIERQSQQGESNPTSSSWFSKINTIQQIFVNMSKCFYTNDTSICNKFAELELNSKIEELDLVFVSETWFSENNLRQQGFESFNYIRKNKVGGGVSIFINKNLNSYEILDNDVCNSAVEQVCGLIICGDFNTLKIDWHLGTLNLCQTEGDTFENNFLDSLNDCFFRQNVYEPTFPMFYESHKIILDLVITDDSFRIYNIEHGPPLGKTNIGHMNLKLEDDL
ncbi:unnamed protein product [Brachionus calyciflorus]|uniref:Endonuclease/exonuclease/phosphatase domain-containing protein n=1 Tax=Brachionus calyciflorus TaxID=104777 RepID=A0A814EF32_9BILA|nr:unnamed protein product [Brachionus calyciflorus]